MNKLNCHVVLVRPIYEWNIGSTSRAMANMGFSRLILIAPQTQIGYPAQQAAATAQKALQERTVYTDWADFFAHEKSDFRLAFSARPGHLRPLWELRQSLRMISKTHPYFHEEKDGSEKSLHLIFGPEDCGLSNEDVAHAHHNVKLPIFGENPSLNLSQAVLLALFILREEWGEFIGQDEQSQMNRAELLPAPRNADSIPVLEISLKNWLNALGLKSGDRRTDAFKVLQRTLLHHIPTEKETRILEIVFEQNRRKLLEYQALQKKLLED